MWYQSHSEILHIHIIALVCRVQMCIRDREKTTDLKEVVVKAPAIYQRGDTLSYNLASYIGKNDYTLKDAIDVYKRQPVNSTNFKSLSAALKTL